MDIEQVIVAVLETGVIGFVVHKIIHGLKVEIGSLKTNIKAQKQTIETMDKRVSETEKIGDLYKQMVSDFPKALDDYRAVITKTKDTTIYELKSKLQEHELTIDNLKDRAELSGSNKSTRAGAIGRIFLEKERKILLDFVKTVDPDVNKVMDALFNNKRFEEFLQEIGKTVEFDEDKNIQFAFMSSNAFQEGKVMSATFSTFGSYVVTTDDKLIISEDLYNRLKEGYETLAE